MTGVLPSRRLRVFRESVIMNIIIILQMRWWGSKSFNNWAKNTQLKRGGGRLPSPGWLAWNPSLNLVHCSENSPACGMPRRSLGGYFRKELLEDSHLAHLPHLLQPHLLEGGQGGALNRGSSSATSFRYAAHAIDTLAGSWVSLPLPHVWLWLP